VGDTPCARAIYWRAKPGLLDAYSDYLRQEVEPIDHMAQSQGALVSFSTLVDTAPDAAWTHMRLFMFCSHEQRDQMGAALARAAQSITPDPMQRAARAARAATLRERVGEADFDQL
jgi:hypothetical protein